MKIIRKGDKYLIEHDNLYWCGYIHSTDITFTVGYKTRYNWTSNTRKCFQFSTLDYAEEQLKTLIRHTTNNIDIGILFSQED